MMMSTVIHIGLPKTATTTLQREVFARHSAINYLGKPFVKKNGHLVEGSSGRLSNHIIGNVWRQDSLTYNGVHNKLDLDTFMANMNLSNTGKTIVVSEEGLSGGGFADRGLVATRLKELFGPAKILITIRNQFTCLPSLHTHYYRKKLISMLQFERWLELVMHSSNFSTMTQQWMLRQYLYHDLLCLYQGVFGQANVKVMLYEQMGQDLATFSREISDFMGIDVDETARLLDSAGRLNVGLTPEGAKREKRYNALEATYKNLRTRFIPNFSLRNNVKWLWKVKQGLIHSRTDSTVGGGELSDAAQQLLSSYYADDNRALAAATGLSLVGYGYPV
jgi:hypothetical protein